MKTKKLGIIGGMGTRAGISFMQKLANYAPAIADQDFPEIIFHNNSKVPDRTKCIVFGEPSPLPKILDSIRLFNDNNVDLIASICVTSYNYYDDMVTHADGRVLNPLKILCDHLASNFFKCKKIGILATKGTIESGLFDRYLISAGFNPVYLTPGEVDNIFMKSIYMKRGLKSSQISKEARSLLTSCAPRLIDQGAEAIIAGCSEIQLVLTQEHVQVPFYDVVDLLAQRLINLTYQEIGDLSLVAQGKE